MKKLIITISIIVALTFILLIVFRCGADAQEVIQETAGEAAITDAAEAEEFNLYNYIKEKILPIVIGVLTSVSALLATLVAVKRSLNALHEEKDNYKKEAAALEKKVLESTKVLSDRVEKLQSAVDEIKKSTSGVPDFDARIEAVQNILTSTCEILTLGFSANADIIKTGKGKKMEILLNSIKEIIGGQDEAEN